MDLHEDIHRAIENYLDENEFRRWLNSAIQNSRGVTFLLQKQKAKWGDFDAWYGEWQERARHNPVLSWGVTARNRIVKEEDLATLSQAVIGVYDTRRRGYQDAFSVPPVTPPEAILASFLKAAAKDGKERHGWIRVSRRWIDDQLPDYELTAALREMYRAVSEVVERAHAASRVTTCAVTPFARECVDSHIDPELDCLGSDSPIPTMLLDMATGKVSGVEFVPIERDEALAEVGRERYGSPPLLNWTDPIEHVVQRMELSKQFLQSDGYAGPMLVLLGGGRRRMFPLPFSDSEPRAAKVAAAVDSVGAWPFDGAVYSSETWLGLPGSQGELLGVPAARLLPSNREFFDSDPRGRRDEALIVVGISADGRSLILYQPFGRVVGGYLFGEMANDDSGTAIPDFLRPVFDRWS